MPATGISELPPVETYGATGNANVDALLSGVSWAPDSGSTVTTVSFSFSGPDSVYHFDLATGYETGDDFNEPTFAITELSAYAQGLFNGYVANLASFSMLDLVEVDDTATTAGTVRVAWSAIDSGEAVAWAYFPGEWVGAGDVWLISANHTENDVDFGHTLLHELGHALGLKHSFEVDGAFPAMDSQYEGVDYTVMSYTVSGRFPDAQWADLWPQTYMYFDILALHELYGVDTVTTAGADTYDFDQSERFLQTVWDYNGTDTLGASNGTVAVDIDLTPGTWSNVGTTIEYWNGGQDYSYDNYTVYIADDTTIENAYGAGGDDTLSGNDVANQLTGNGGADKLSGEAGDDQLSGGSGADRLLGGTGDDLLEGGTGNDVLRGDAGDDVSSGGDGNDQLYAGAGDTGNDVAIGGAGNDVVGGAGGNDLIVGGGADEGSVLQLLLTSGNSSDDGSDTLYGGDGNDTLLGGGWDDGAAVDNGFYNTGEAVTTGTGDDVIWAGSGDDLVIGAAGDDVQGGGTGDDTIMAGGGADTIYGGAGDGADTGSNDVIHGEAGADLIFAGGGNDSIDGGTGDDELFSGAGADTVVGGDGNDTLYGGGGDDSFTGGAGADAFIFAAGHSDDRVTDFSLTEDELRLTNTTTDFIDSDDVTAAATEQNGGLLIDLGGGDSVFLEGLSLGDIPSMTLVL